jgi:hypothetical protein
MIEVPSFPDEEGGDEGDSGHSGDVGEAVGESQGLDDVGEDDIVIARARSP